MQPVLSGTDILVTPLADFGEIKKRIQSIYKNEDVRIISVKELV